MKNGKHPESSNVIEFEPDARSAKEFTSKKWNVPSEELLLHGNDQFPDMYRRQDRLVGNTLDACVVLHVYEQLKWGLKFDQLKKFFPGKITPDEIEILNRGNMPLDPGEIDPRLDLLVRMTQEPGETKRIVTHHYSVNPEEFRKYHEKHKKYREKLVEFKADPTNLEKPERPPDPRIARINNMIAEANPHNVSIQVWDSGPKELGKAKANARKKGIDVNQVRDLNRITVLPSTPEYTRDFIEILTLFNPAKHIPGNVEGGSRRIPRVFVEDPEVFANGYYGQKINVALDRDTTEEGRTGDNTAAIAEIKIVPARMFRAEKLTAILKPVIESLSTSSKYVSSGSSETKDQEAMQNRRKLRGDYLKAEIDFQEKIDEFKQQDKTFPDYHFPKFPEGPEFNRESTCKALGKQILELSRTIQTDSIKREVRAWREEYLRAALIQRMYFTEAGFAKRAKQVFKKDFQYTVAPDNSLIKMIADNDNLSIPKMESKIRQEVAAAQLELRAQAAEARRLARQ